MVGSKGLTWVVSKCLGFMDLYIFYPRDQRLRQCVQISVSTQSFVDFAKMFEDFYFFSGFVPNLLRHIFETETITAPKDPTFWMFAW